MTWPAVALAALNVVQVVALAWIAYREQAVKRQLEAHNGAQAAAIAELRAALEATSR